jgi:hypothetical protein
VPACMVSGIERPRHSSPASAMPLPHSAGPEGPVVSSVVTGSTQTPASQVRSPSQELPGPHGQPSAGVGHESVSVPVLDEEVLVASVLAVLEPVSVVGDTAASSPPPESPQARANVIAATHPTFVAQAIFGTVGADSAQVKDLEWSAGARMGRRSPFSPVLGATGGCRPDAAALASAGAHVSYFRVSLGHPEPGAP